MIVYSVDKAGTIPLGTTVLNIINSSAFTLSANPTQTNTAITTQFLTNTAFNAVATANVNNVSNLEYQIIKNEADFVSKTGTFDTDVKFIARYPGELGNSLRVSIVGTPNGHNSSVPLATYANGAAYAANSVASFKVASGGNTGAYSVIANANTNANLIATSHKSALVVNDLLEIGDPQYGTQFVKITSVGSITNYGTTNVNTTFDTNVGSNVVTLSSVTNLAAGMEVASVDGTGFSLLGARVVSVNATAAVLDKKYTGSANLVANNIAFFPRTAFTVSFEEPYTLAEDYTFSSSSATVNSIPRYWSYFNLVDQAPGQSDYQREFGNSAVNADELHIVVSDEDGNFTGVPGTVLEVYRGVSRATDAKTIDGATNYWKDVINDASQYVYAVNDLPGASSATAAQLTSSTLSTLSYDMVLGNDGKNEADISLSTLTTAYNKFASVEEVDVNLILQGRARTSVLANYLIDNIAEKRKDAVVFISPQKADVVNNVGFEADSIVTFRNNLRSSSYAMMDSGYKYMYDRYNDLYRWVPLNGDIAGLCARTDETNDPWWSPAGYNRGQIRNVVRLAYNPSKTDRDTLYKNGVNPVISERGQGTLLFGDKTLLSRPSAFDRINVRRLFIVLEKAISAAAKSSLFEFNDDFTRSQFKNLVNPYLRDVKGRRGITDFLVVCDDTNNTPEVIDRNEFVGDIYIKPARSINFIQLNFVAVRTGVAFSEVVGQF